MYQRLCFFLLIIFLLSAQSSFTQRSSAKKKREFVSILDANKASSVLAGGRGPVGVTWIDNGKRFSYIKQVNNKQQIWTYNPQTEQQELIFDPSDISIPGSNKSFTFVSFQWSKDSKFMLFQSNFISEWRRTGIADYYFYSIADKTLKLIAKDAQTAEISPDGTKVGFEKNGNLFVFDFSSEKTTQFTFDTKDYFYNGRFGWVYAEEFGLPQAWVWSPDS